MRNCYVSLNSHYYSVPKEYIGDTVELLYDGDIVEITSVPLKLGRIKN